MKKFTLLGFTAVLALIFMVGCAGKAHKEGSQAAASIQNVEREARVAKNNVNATVTSLDALFNNPKGNLKKQFRTYSKSVDDLEKQAKRVKDRNNTMISRKSDYLEEWDNQMAGIESDNIRQTAEQRRQKVEEMFAKVQSELKKAGEAYDPFINKLNDIRTAMNMDLNRNGLNAMLPIAQNAKIDAVNINSKLDAAISALREASKALTKK